MTHKDNDQDSKRGVCEIKFELFCQTNFGDEICVVGNLPQLGNWNPQRGIILKTDRDNYPNWYSESPLMLMIGVKFQFKFVKIENNNGCGTYRKVSWESFTNSESNRNYRTRYHSVTLKAQWNDFSGRELATKKYPSSSNAFEEGELQVQKIKISGLFVPYEQDGLSSAEDSDYDEYLDQHLKRKRPLFKRQLSFGEPKQLQEQQQQYPLRQIAHIQPIQTNNLIENSVLSPFRSTHEQNFKKINQYQPDFDDDNSSSDDDDNVDQVIESTSDLSRSQSQCRQKTRTQCVYNSSTIQSQSSTSISQIEQNGLAYQKKQQPFMQSPLKGKQRKKNYLDSDGGNSDDDVSLKLFESAGHRLQKMLEARKQNALRNNINTSAAIAMTNNQYSALRSENDICFQVSEEFLVHMSRNDQVCLATLFLPISLSYDSVSDTLSECLDEHTVDYHLNGSYTSLFRVGLIRGIETIPGHLHERVSKLLINKYRFYPIFIDQQALSSFLNEFCSNMYDDIMSNSFSIHTFRLSEFSMKTMENVKMISFIFAAEISKLIDEDTNVIIADHRILFSITYLAQYNARKMKIAYFHPHAFPTIEQLQLLPFSEKLVHSILCANLISFSNYQNAQNFIKYMRINLKIDSTSVRGNLSFVYMGSQIIVQIRNIGINTNLVASVAAAATATPTSEKQNSISFMSIDYLNENSQILLNLKLFQRFYNNHPNLNASFVLIILQSTEVDLSYSMITILSFFYQNTCQNDSRNTELMNKINNLVNETNNISSNRMGATTTTSTTPVRIINNLLSLTERINIMSSTDIFLQTGFNSKTQLFPLEFIAASKNNGICMLSKNVAASFNGIRSCLAFNSSSYREFETIALELTKMSPALKEQIHMKDSEMIAAHYSVQLWVEKHICELKKNAKFMSQASLTGLNKGINFVKVAHHPNFKRINQLDTNELYRTSVKRLILFGYLGTVVPLDRHMYIQAEEHQVRRYLQKPSEKIIDSLTLLCSDKKNLVYILTEQPTDFISEWFSEVKGLGIICEDGYYHKVIQETHPQTSLSSSTPWMRLIDADLSWKSRVYQIMQRFTTYTQGSSVEVKDSSIIWKYSKVPVDFGINQAVTLIQQLKQQLSLPSSIEIVHQPKEFVEIKPRAINKGIMTEVLIERMEQEYGQIDYLMAFGSSTSDEDIFYACQNYSRQRQRDSPNVRLRPLCVKVGVKPSVASYHIEFEDTANFIEQIVISQSFAPQKYPVQ